MQHTNMLRRFCVVLGVGGKENYGITCEFCKERQQQELYACENSFFLSYFKFTVKTWGRNFPCLSDNAYFRCTSFLSFQFGRFLHENVIALADVFPIFCQWKNISV